MRIRVPTDSFDHNFAAPRTVLPCVTALMRLAKRLEPVALLENFVKTKSVHTRHAHSADSRPRRLLQVSSQSDHWMNSPCNAVNILALPFLMAVAPVAQRRQHPVRKGVSYITRLPFPSMPPQNTIFPSFFYQTRSLL